MSVFNPLLKSQLIISAFAVACLTSCTSVTTALSDFAEQDVDSSLFVNEQSRLSYQVSFKGKPVVLPSELGITVDGIDLGQGVELGLPELKEVSHSYQSIGSTEVKLNQYSQLSYPVKHLASGKEYRVEIREYEDGVAYRYIVPGNSVQHVNGESSSWTLADGLKTWLFERPNHWKLKSYAGYWIDTDVSQLPTISKAGPVHGTPIVFELPDHQGYAAITKAALYNYSGMRLKATGNNTLVANFTEGNKGFDVDGTIVTPWRVTMLADDLNELATSHLIANLNPAPDEQLFADETYIQPGRSVWRWPTSFTGNPQQEKEFVDYAKELGFEYSLVDGKWENWQNQWPEIHKLVDYANTQGVGIWTWVHSKVLRDPANNYAKMRAYFDKVKAAGIVGMKIDFMDGETKELVDFEITALRMAAERQLMINFHGCHSSTGESRSYPNEMTREGVRGIELNNMKVGPLTASHNASLPFTRFIVGHADYTPVYYNNPGKTSWAHQLATDIIYFSPLQVIAEHPGMLLRHPQAKAAVEVLKEIPTVWDEVKVLPGSDIGKLAAFAKRKGDQWFVAAINGEQTSQFELDLSFLSKGDYQVEWVVDDLAVEPVALEGLSVRQNLKSNKTAIPFKVTQRVMNQSSKESIQFTAGGGLVAVFTPID